MKLFATIQYMMARLSALAKKDNRVSFVPTLLKLKIICSDQVIF